MNGRVAVRLAGGLSQADVAAAWTQRWPDDAKTFKNISYWENWPSPTGHAPSLTVLDRLAQVYGCDVTDLVAGWGEHAGSVPSAADDGTAARALAWEVDQLDLPQLAASLGAWAGRFPADRRRSMLLKLSTAASVAASSLGEPGAVHRGAASSRIDELAGAWISTYRYVSTGRQAELENSHRIELRARHGRLVGRSELTPIGDLDLDLGIEGTLVTGAWTERTTPTGYYRGAVYHGVVQMVLDPAGRTMTGRWLGADNQFAVNSGSWTLSRG